jgi:hypothetical protein
MRALVGGCRCGHIRYEITEQPWFGFACHCTDCQQLTASAFSLGITVPESGFRLVQNRPQQWTKIGSSGRPSHQFTCPNCSGWTHTKPEVLTGGLVVRPMTLDDHHGFRPVCESFTRSALPWARLGTPFSFETDFEDIPLLKQTFEAVIASSWLRDNALKQKLLFLSLDQSPKHPPVVEVKHERQGARAPSRRRQNGSIAARSN